VTHLRTIILVSLFTVAACGSDKGPHVTSLSDAEQQLERAFCNYSARCGEIGTSEESSCEQLALAALSSLHVSYFSEFISYGALDDAVANGRRSFDAQTASNCIANVQSASCGTALQSAEQCLKAFSGLVPIGGVCKTDADCTTGFCILAGSSCEGVCQNSISIGASCANNSNGCDSGSYCSIATQTCTPVAAAAATCEWQPEVATCQSDQYCDPLTSACKPRLGVGGTCISDDYCQVGARCSSGKCAMSAGEGGSCTQATDCLSGSYCVGYAPPGSGMPAIPGTCRAAMGNIGGPCSSESCSAGLFCDVSQRPPSCTSRVDAGGACSQAGACKDGLVCVAGSCAAFSDIGRSCDPSASVTTCPADMACDKGTKTCIAVGLLDGSCSAARCRRLLYCDPNLKCANQAATGAACAPPATGGPNPCAVGACDAIGKVCAVNAC
jgi:hypothetical protein